MKDNLIGKLAYGGGIMKRFYGTIIRLSQLNQEKRLMMRKLNTL